MGSVNSRLGLRKSAKITHSDFEGKLEDEALENETRQASKQAETHDSTQAKRHLSLSSTLSFPCFGQKNKTGLKEERRQTGNAGHREGISKNARAKHNVEEMRMHEKDSAERILDMEAQIRQLKYEKGQLITRLSEIGAVRLLDNNPNLADLSDANRPEKLMEQFAEIYDNEWTNAFECLTGTSELQEEDAIKELLRILHIIYTECLSASRKHSERLKKAIVRYLGISKMYKQIHLSKKHYFPQEEDLVIKETEKRLREFRGKNPDLNITSIGKKIKKRFKGQIEDKVCVATDKYIQVCTRVCWLMCIKDPQMHLHFGDSPGNDHNHGVNQDVHIFNATQFVSYTRTGMYVKYVVWPALFLYKDGPIMKKGVAQGSHGKPTKHEITADNKDGNEYDSVKCLGVTRQVHTEVDYLSNYCTGDNMVKENTIPSKDISKDDVSGHARTEYVIIKENQSSKFITSSSTAWDSDGGGGRGRGGRKHEGKTSFNRELVNCTNNVLFYPDLTTGEFKNGKESSGNIYGKHKKKKKSIYSSLKDKPSN